ncbi:MAG: alpha/beta fold hydrolase [Owenweeksia sp.]
MKKFLLLPLCLSFSILYGQRTIYSHAYGSQEDPALIFLHGGPGYNSFSFEQVMADSLVKRGYFFIVFDQRGCGRSSEVENAGYTFEEAFADLDSIYLKYGIHTASLIGHSWGGTLGIKYARSRPEKVTALILTDSPLSYQQAFRTIIKRCKKIYTDQGASQQLKYINTLENSDTNSLNYSSFCFMHAMGCGLYNPSEPTAESKALMLKIEDHKRADLLRSMTRSPVSGFFSNENYTTLDMEKDLKALKDVIPVSGIYGEDDGLFDEAHFKRFRDILGNENFYLVENAGHNVFIDQQPLFLDLVDVTLKKVRN